MLKPPSQEELDMIHNQEIQKEIKRVIESKNKKQSPQGPKSSDSSLFE